MELLFVYEDKIACDSDGNYYTGSAFSQSVFDRYLEHFDKITLIMRRAKVDPNDRETLSRMNKIDSSRIDVVIIPNLMESIRSFLSIKLRRKLRKTVKENITPDRAVIIRMCSGSGTVAARYCKKIGKPFLTEAVGCPWDSLWNHSLFGKILAPFSWMKMRRTMKISPYSVYVTEEFLQRRYPTKGKTAAISDVELQSVDESVLRNRLKKIEDHTGKIKIGTGAAVNVAFKGQRFVIQALAKLKAKGNTDFEYHLAGGGDNSTLKNLAEQLGVADQVVFEGSLPHDKMFGWLDSMDVYIQPSLTEGLPRSVVEAMSRGLPCFVSRVGGMPELVDGDAIFASKDIDGIAEKLEKLTKPQMKHMAEKNFTRAADFDKQRLAEKRRAFYAEFAAAAKEYEK